MMYRADLPDKLTGQKITQLILIELWKAYETLMGLSERSLYVCAYACFGYPHLGRWPSG